MRAATLARGVCSALLLALGPGCAAEFPAGAFAPDESTLQKRSLESRRYSGIAEAELLRAGAGVLQDLGFTIDESETRLGVIVGSKTRTAKDDAERFWKGLGCILGALDRNPSICNHPVKDRQILRASLVTRPADYADRSRHIVRITFQRQVLDTYGNAVVNETMNDEKFYLEFFDKLSKSIFLEGEKI